MPGVFEKALADEILTQLRHYKEYSKIVNKEEIEGVEAMEGPLAVDWVNDLDYTIYLDVKSKNDKHGFTGFLFGSPKNEKI